MRDKNLMMLDSLRSIDQNLFFFLNGFHTAFFDQVMIWGTKSLIWIPLYVIMIYLVFRAYKWQCLWIILFAAVMILVSDQLSGIFKDWIGRPRPTHEPGLSGVHTVNGYVGGQLGFYSAHASTTMSIAVFLILILGKNYQSFFPVLLLWAMFMAYTRIYLGVHYPGDILAGWLAGSFIGFCFGAWCLRFIRKRTIMQG